MSTLVASETLAIPASHLDLLTRAICGVLTTIGRDGQPQSSLVWVDADGECARVNTTLERQKGRNLLADPKVSLLVVDPDNTGRFIQIRGDADLVPDGAARIGGGRAAGDLPYGCHGLAKRSHQLDRRAAFGSRALWRCGNGAPGRHETPGPAFGHRLPRASAAQCHARSRARGSILPDAAIGAAGLW
ncbi:MAG: PPOX class F420-dependent oxidoreductase, partial [Candidatus Limnocylindrales bacterium]